MAVYPNTVAIGSFSADLDGSGGDFRCTASLAGWGDAPAIRSGITDKAQQDGGWDASGYYSPRVVTIAGEVLQTSHAAAKAVADQLTALTPRSLHELVVDNSALGPRSALVRITGGAALEWVGPVRFRYTITVTAPDPLKYGPATFASTSLSGSAGGAGLTYPLAYPLDYGVAPGTTPGALSVANAGTASYWPRLRIDGPVPNPRVTLVETGDTIRYGATLAAGQWLDIDCANRRVLLNGQVSVRHLITSSGSWLAIPTGGGSMTWTADAADPVAKLSVWGYEGAWV